MIYIADLESPVRSKSIYCFLINVAHGVTKRIHILCLNKTDQGNLLSAKFLEAN